MYTTPKGNVYIEVPAELSRQELFTAFVHPLAGMSLEWFSAFLHNSPALLEDIKEVTDLGAETISIEGEGDVETRHLGLSTDRFKMELWLTPGKAPYLRKYTLDPAPLIAASGQGDNLSVLFTTSIGGGAPEKPFEENLFTFVPPEGAKLQKDEPQEEMGGGPGLNEPAPAIKLSLLGEGTLDLSSYKDKNIVVLDFWATWCGPCRMTLPAVNKVAKAYAEKGVKVFAVNQQEDPAQVKSFLEKEGLTLTVALDSEGKAADAYGVRGIPHLVIIDKKGVVRRIHQGASPDAETQISRELDELLAE